MADYTLRQALDRLETLGSRIATTIYTVMKDETPVGPTGELEKSIYWKQTGSEEWFIGTDMYYAKWVENGRGPVRAKYAPFLKYIDYYGGKKSIHFGTKGAFIKKKAVNRADPNPFVDRTKQRIEKMTFTL